MMVHLTNGKTELADRIRWVDADGYMYTERFEIHAFTPKGGHMVRTTYWPSEVLKVTIS